MKKLKVIKCASCGAELEIKSTRSKFVNCQYCGNSTDLSGILVTVEKGDPEKFKPNSFLKLGMIGIFNDIPYKIIGRTCWRNDYKEYDAEDYQYSDETWRFDEWILLSDEGNYMTIIEDGEGYSFSQTTVPIFPNIKTHNNIRNFETGAFERANEFGKSTIEYFEGESTYLIQTGDYSFFTQYEKGNTTFIAEWREKEGKIFEIEFFKEQAISKNKLLEAFKDNPELSDLIEDLEKENKASETNRKILLGFGLINLIIAIIFSLLSEKNKTLFSRNITIHKENWSALNDTMLIASGDLDTILNFIPKTRESYIEVSANFPQNGVEISSKLTIQDEHKQTIAEINDFFYQYKSTSKKASKTNKWHYFNLDKSLKNLKFNVEYELPLRCLSKANGIKLHYLIRIKGRDYNTMLAYVFGILFLIVGIRKKS